MRFTSQSKIGAMIASLAATMGSTMPRMEEIPDSSPGGARGLEYFPRYGSYSRFREQFRDDEARIQRAAERRARKAKGNGYVYTPPDQLRRERNRGHSHARYIK